MCRGGSVALLILGCAGPSHDIAPRDPAKLVEPAETSSLEPDPGATDAAARPVANLESPSPRAECGPREGGTHCIVLELRRPSPELAREVAALLVGRGHAASAAEDRVEVVLSDDGVARLLSARVVYSVHAASATDRMICKADLEGAHIPPRLRRHVLRAFVGHQLCE